MLSHYANRMNLNLSLLPAEISAMETCAVFGTNPRNIAIFLLLSVSVHAALLVHFGSAGLSQPMPHAEGHSIEIQLTTPAAEQPPQVDQDVVPMPPPEPQKKPAPTPTEVKQQVITTQTTAATEMPRPRAVATESITDDTLTEEATTTEPETTPPLATSASPAPNPATLETERQHYLRRIAAHLEKHKYYPHTARRRHIEGNVQVSFDLLNNGAISNLQIGAAHSSLQLAVRESIHSALPFPAMPEDLQSLRTVNIEYVMQFSLQD